MTNRQPARDIRSKVDLLAACELRLSSTFVSRRLEDDSTPPEPEERKLTKGGERGSRFLETS